MGNAYNTKKDLIRNLAKHNLCHKEAITREEAEKYIEQDDFYVDIEGSYYLCSLDDITNTRILLRMFKCLNFIENFILISLLCGGVGAFIALVFLK